MALAAWTGGHANPNRTASDPRFVIIGDAPPPDGGDYSKSMAMTLELSERLVEPTEVARKHMRRLAFRLDRRAVSRNFPELLA